MGTETGEMVIETSLGLLIILAEAGGILRVLRGTEAIVGVLRDKIEAKVTSPKLNALDVTNLGITDLSVMPGYTMTKLRCHILSREGKKKLC
jgi:hypothetical protein